MTIAIIATALVVFAAVWFVIGRRRARVQPPIDPVDTAIDREITFHEKEAKLRRLEAEIEKKRKPPSQT